MRPFLTATWWAWLFRGILFLVFALLALLAPGITATTFALWLAIFLFIDGVILLIQTVRHWKETEDKWMFLVEAVLSIALGVLLINRPEITLLYVSLLVSFWFIYSGIVKISLGIQMRKEVTGEGWIIAGGIISVLLGVIVLSNPMTAISALMIMLGIFAALAGALMLIIAFRIKKLKGRIEDVVRDRKSVTGADG